MSEYKRAKITAEIGGNHMGKIENAKDMIKVAALFCKVDNVKFQKRCTKEVLTEEEYSNPHPEPKNSFGKTYGEHRDFLEFNLEQHAILKKEAETYGIEYSTSVWDLTSAKEIVSLNPKFIKIPSACNTNFGLLEYLIKLYSGEVHVSLGMTTVKEEEEIFDFFVKYKANERLVLYSCTSGYPVPYEDVALLEIKRLRKKYENDVLGIGFSGHHKGIAVDYAAYTLGATYIERHFTLDRTWKGTDQAASLEPDGMRRIVENIKDLQMALNYKKKEILEIEEVQRKKLKWNRKHNEISQISVPTVGKSIEKKAPTVEYDNIKLFVTDVDGTLTNGGMYYDQNGNELKKFNTIDGKGIALLKEVGIKICFITSENTKIVKNRAKKLNVDYLIQDSSDKVKDLEKIVSNEKLIFSEIAYIGDDINDLEIMRKVGYSFCPNNANSKIKETAKYICKNIGGNGAVREVCDLIIRLKGK